MACSQYPVGRVTEVHPDDNGVVRNVTIMTANHNELKPDLQPERTTLKRDTMKLALIKYPEINHMTETIYDRQQPDTEQYRWEALIYTPLLYIVHPVF